MLLPMQASSKIQSGVEALQTPTQSLSAGNLVTGELLDRGIAHQTFCSMVCVLFSPEQTLSSWAIPHTFPTEPFGPNRYSHIVKQK